jgi:leader peptidase (prepilin peptidase)/N-methyltransferase
MQDRWTKLVGDLPKVGGWLASPATGRQPAAWIAGLGAAIAATSFLIFAWPVALASCLLGWTMLAIAIADARRFIVPDILSLPAIPAGLIVTWLLDDGAGHSLSLEHLGAAALGGALLYAIKELYFRWRQREGLGLGDVKLAAAAGAWTGLAGLGHVLLFASLLAIGYVLMLNARDLRSLGATTAIAFGVFLAPAIWFVWCANTLGLDLSVARLLG